MIKHVHIRNFKSLEDVQVALDPVTVLIGQSGSGKSNFVEALRWLRDYLTHRNDGAVGHLWPKVMSATAPKPMTIAFDLTFNAPGIAEDYQYRLEFQQPQENGIPQFAEEELRLGGKVLFHQRQRKWVKQPPLVVFPPAGNPVLGALTGFQEATIAHLLLTTSIGCYAFPDRVLARPQGPNQKQGSFGLADNGDNFLQTVIEIIGNLSTWHHLRELTASLRRLKPQLKSVDLQQPGHQEVVVSHESNGRLLVFSLDQESEGFRRLLACLIALYQSPPKQTLIFDEPEKGIYPAGLVILADEFKGYAKKGRGQVILTTHSPEFLDQFSPEQIRVVEMKGYATQIGPVASEQLDALREHFMKPSELLTVDEARLNGSLAEAK